MTISAFLFLISTIIRIIVLFLERKRYSILLKNAQDRILICNPDGYIKEFLNAEIAATKLFDYFDKSNQWELSQSLNTVSNLATGQNISLDITSYKNEDELFYHINMENQLNKAGIRGIIITIRDVSQSKLLERHLIRSRQSAYHEARHDPLTGIPNRLYFNESIQRRFSSLERNTDETISLLMMDLDHFKLVNDTFGHDVGDEVLIQISTICTDMIRGSDIIARYGGEEFIFFLDNLDHDGAMDVAERMRKKIEGFKDWSQQIDLTVSIGLVEYNKENNPEDLIKKADIALYKAKATGRNRVCYFREEE